VSHVCYIELEVTVIFVACSGRGMRAEKKRWGREQIPALVHEK
jgi:hypothetical protein